VRRARSTGPHPGHIPSLANLAAYGPQLHHTQAFYSPAYASIFFRDMTEQCSALEPSSFLQQVGFHVVVVLAGAALAVGLGKGGEGSAIRMKARYDVRSAAYPWSASRSWPCALISAGKPLRTASSR
jgi:hypothetical protein